MYYEAESWNIMALLLFLFITTFQQPLVGWLVIFVEDS